MVFYKGTSLGTILINILKVKRYELREKFPKEVLKERRLVLLKSARAWVLTRRTHFQVHTMLFVSTFLGIVQLAQKVTVLFATTWSRDKVS